MLDLCRLIFAIASDLLRSRVALEGVDCTTSMSGFDLRQAQGHSSECFSFIKDWVEKKVRRHLVHAQKRKGFGWERWNRRWLYDTLGLFNAYRVRRDGPKVAPAA